MLLHDELIVWLFYFVVVSHGNLWAAFVWIFSDESVQPLLASQSAGRRRIFDHGAEVLVYETMDRCNVVIPRACNEHV